MQERRTQTWPLLRHAVRTGTQSKWFQSNTAGQPDSTLQILANECNDLGETITKNEVLASQLRKQLFNERDRLQMAKQRHDNASEIVQLFDKNLQSNSLASNNGQTQHGNKLIERVAVLANQVSGMRNDAAAYALRKELRSLEKCVVANINNLESDNEANLSVLLCVDEDPAFEGSGVAWLRRCELKLRAFDLARNIPASQKNDDQCNTENNFQKTSDTIESDETVTSNSDIAVTSLSVTALSNNGTVPNDESGATDTSSEAVTSESDNVMAHTDVNSQSNGVVPQTTVTAHSNEAVASNMSDNEINTAVKSESYDSTARQAVESIPEGSNPAAAVLTALEKNGIPQTIVTIESDTTVPTSPDKQVVSNVESNENGETTISNEIKESRITEAEQKYKNHDQLESYLIPQDVVCFNVTLNDKRTATGDGSLRFHTRHCGLVTAVTVSVGGVEKDPRIENDSRIGKGRTVNVTCDPAACDDDVSKRLTDLFRLGDCVSAVCHVLWPHMAAQSLATRAVVDL